MQFTSVNRPSGCLSKKTKIQLANDLIDLLTCCSEMGIESTMVGYYAKRAQEYERIFHKPERQDDLRTLRRFVGQTFAGKHVLEVACGTGYWTEILSNPSASVTAVDINDEVLEIARAKPFDQQKVSFHRADAYSLPAFSQRFSGSLAGFW